jgi:hypothetical protein
MRRWWLSLEKKPLNSCKALALASSTFPFFFILLAHGLFSFLGIFSAARADTAQEGKQNIQNFISSTTYARWV